MCIRDSGNYYEMRNNAISDMLEPGSTFKTTVLRQVQMIEVIGLVYKCLVTNYFAEMCIRDRCILFRRYVLRQILADRISRHDNLVGREELLHSVISNANPVSYTHLDVYKRQVLKR